jgi:hypothetical protein
MPVHSAPCLREQMANQSSLGVSFPKPSSFRATFFSQIVASCNMAGLILGIDFLRKFRITVAPETSQVLFACMAMASATAELFLPNVSPVVKLIVPVPSATQKIPDFVPDVVKRLLKKFPSILRMGDVIPTPTHGVEHYIHTAVIPQYLQNPTAWIRKNLKLQKRNSNVWNPPALFVVQNHHGPLPCTWCPKKMDPGNLVTITVVSIW